MNAPQRLFDEENQAYGVAIAPSEPMTPSTLNYGASTTKAQLCALWAIYIDSASNQGKGKEKITLATPIAKIIPSDFVLTDEYATNHITLDDCLAHRTGYPNHIHSFGQHGVQTTKDVTRNLRNLPAKAELRHGFEYTNLMYIAASYALESLLGKSLSQIFRDHLWGPLGMNDTYGGYGEAAKALEEKGGVLAPGYTWTKLPGDEDESIGNQHQEKYMVFPEFAGAGYVISTADDYAKWMRCILDGSHPLSANIVKDLFKPRAIVVDVFPGDGPVDGTVNYSLGWFTGTYRSIQIFWNPGLLVGSGSSVFLVPSLRWGVSFFGNGANSGSKMKCLIYRLLDQVTGTPKEESGYEKSNDLVMSAYVQLSSYSKKSIADLYPTAGSKMNVPSGLPIEDYAGTYTHPGYGPVTWTAERDAEGPYLQLKLVRTFSRNLILRHVNAEFWLGVSWYDTPAKSSFRAQTRVSVAGQPEAIGMAIEGIMPETLIWFTRV